MVDVPHKAPHEHAKGLLAGIKKLPPWALVAIVGVGVLLVALTLRRKSAEKAAVADEANAMAEVNADEGDPNDPNYTIPTSGSGLNRSQGPIQYSGNLFGVGNPGQSAPAPAAQGSPNPPISISLQPVPVNVAMTGGGPPARPNPNTTVHTKPGVHPARPKPPTRHPAGRRHKPPRHKPPRHRKVRH